MSLTVVAILAALGAGFGAGWGLKKDRSSDLLKAQSQSIDVILDRQTEILTAAAEPIVIDAEVRAALADTPPACIRSMGGDPSGPACMMVTCWSYGQSAAQRPECNDLQDEVLKVLQKKWGVTE